MARKYLSSISLLLFSVGIMFAQDIQNIPTIDESIIKNGKTQIEFSVDEFYSQLKHKDGDVDLPYLSSTKNFKVKEFSLYGNTKSPYPEIKTYKIHTLEGERITGRITAGPEGVMISYLNGGKLIRIYPDVDDKDSYYQEIGITREEGKPVAICNEHGEINYSEDFENHLQEQKGTPLKTNGSTKRIYRVAIISTGEYYDANGGSFTAVNQWIQSNLNDISAIYERDLAVELVMATGSPKVETDPNADPFMPDNSGGQPRTTQAQNEISNRYPDFRYDIGHVFHNHTSGDGWSGGGLAGLSVVCDDNRKASGWSGSFNNQTNSFIQLAAHEFGHQFSATHTFNGIGGSCEEGNHPIATAYEIGSGTTIMSYQGICDPEYNIPTSGVLDNYFNINSLDRMVNFMEIAGVCNEVDWISDNNNPPVIMANPCSAEYNLPRLTPFFLTGSATDEDDDVLTYCWEGYDEDGASNRDTHGDIGTEAAMTSNAPLWRSYPPSLSPTRYFPRIEDVKDNERSDFEVLPNRARGMRMRLTVRDNNPEGGAIDWEQIAINVESTMGPLQVTAPNGGESIAAGEMLTVTWSPRNSESMCANAAIRLSTDGGLNFPFVLATEVDYSAGTADVLIPASFPNSDNARLMVACDDYECFQWYDMSNNDFTLESDCFAPGIILCDETGGEFEFGDPALDFGLETIKGDMAVEYSGSVENVPPTMPVAVNDFNSNCTRVGTANNAFDTLRFAVTESGSYDFLINTNGAAFIKAYTIFDAETFDSNNACPSFIESNASFVGSFSYLPTVFTAPLDACKEYLFASQITSADTRTIALTGINGPGDFIILDKNPDYAVTFLAVDKSSGEIRFITNTSDFTSTEAGEYHIHAAAYKTGGAVPPDDVDLNSWIGMTLNELLNTGDCYRISSNYKDITIISTCSLFDVELGDQSACDPLNNTYSQILRFKIDKGPGTGTLMVNGQSFDVAADSMEIQLTGLVADGQAVDLAITFSDDVSCNTVLNDLFVAPENCCPITLDLGEDLIMECEGNSISLDAGTDGTTYEWFRNDVLLAETTKDLLVEESGNYRVVVTDGNGCSKPDMLDIQFNPNPVIDDIMDINACTGDVFEIVAVTDADSIEWYKDGAFVSSFDTLLVAEDGDYMVVAINEFDCSVSTSFQATFLDAPIVELGEDLVLCEGDTLILDAGDPNNLFAWAKDAVQISETSSMLEVTEDGDYLVVAVNSNFCETIDQINVSFRQLPDLELGVDMTFCSGETYEIEANANGFDIEWYVDDELIVGEQDDVLSVSQTGVYKAIVFANVDCSIADEVSVTFNESPTVDLGEDKLLCEGVIETLDGGDASNSFVWTLDGLDLMNDSNTFDATGNGTYVVIATNANNCSTSDTTVLSFNPLPEINLGEDQDLCEDLRYTIIATTNGFDIIWSRDGNEIIGATDLELLADMGGQYVARVYSGVDCFTEDTININYNPLPTIDLGSDKVACEGEIIVFDAGAGGFEYRWFVDGVLSQEGTDNLFEVTSDAQIIVIAENQFECTSSDTINASFIATPMVTLDDDFDFCEGVEVTINSTSNVSSVTWYLNGQEIIGENDLTLNTSSSGEYVAVVGTGGICEDRDTIVVNAIAAPEFTISGKNEECEGEQIILSVDNDAGETIEWFMDGNLLAQETSPFLQVNESGQYSAVLSNTTGCQSEQIFDVAFLPVPENLLAIVPDLCEGDTYVMVVQTDGVTFQWEDQSGIIPGETTNELEITESGTYTFTAFNSIGCGSINFFLMEFAPIPISDLGADMSACFGESILLSVPDNQDNDYEWSLDGNIITGETENTISITDSGNYSLIVTNDSECSSQDDVDIVFDNPPNLDYVDSASYCEGSSVDLSINTDANSIAWNLNGNNQGQDVTSITVSSPGNYLIEVTSDEECTISGNITVEEFANPVVSIDNIDLCPGESQDISVDSGFSTYTWDGIVGTGPDITVPYEEFTQITTQSASLTVVDQNNCSAIETFDVTYFPPINASVGSSAIGLCLGETVTLQSSGGLVYEWTDPNGTLSDINIPNPVASPSETTTYSVMISDNCPNNVANLEVFVQVNDPPEANAGRDTCILIGLPFELNASGGVAYSWDNQLSIVGSSNIANPEINIDTATVFTVTVTDANGCQDTDQIQICIIEDPSSILDAVSILTPNGDGKNDELVFKGLEAFPENKLTIFNRWGNIIYEKVGYQRDGQRWVGLRDGQELPADTYYYVLEFADLQVKTSLTIIRE